MKGCHRCKHASAIAAGKYASRKWKDTPCSTCAMPRSSGLVMEYNEDLHARPAPEPDDDSDEPRLPVSVLTGFVVGVLSLPPASRDVVCARYLGRTYVDIARDLGVTPAVVEHRLRRALDRWPALKALFCLKAAKQARRQRHH